MRSLNYEGMRTQIFQPVAAEFPRDKSNSLRGIVVGHAVLTLQMKL